MDLQRFLQLALHELESGAPSKCLDICNEILAAEPGLIHAMYLRGCAAYHLDNNDKAIDDLSVVFTNHPDHPQAAYYLGSALIKAGRFEEALPPLTAALAADDLAVHAHYKLATGLGRLRRRAEAIDHYRKVLELQPDNAQAAANLAATLERDNRLAEAAEWADRALSMDATNQTARMARATLDRRSGHPAEAVDRLRALLPDIDHPVNGSVAWNQLGQCLEDMAEWDQAFDAFSQSNQMLVQFHPAARPDPAGPLGMKTLSRISAWLENGPIKDWAPAAEDDPGGIAFLVGFPRSGTTLLGQMLGAHPDIEVLEEKNLFAGLHQKWSEPGVLEALTDIRDEQIYDARRVYREEMARHRQPGQPAFVVDKLPLNLAYVFLIHRLFPDAPIIFAQRHPLDACISCYCQAFELGASMGYFLDLGQTANFYDAVMQVGLSSIEQIGNPVHALHYEDLVAQPEEQLRALFEFLGLEYSGEILDNRAQDGDGSSDTPSYQQVTQPLYTRSIGRWQHYRAQMAPVLPVVEPWVSRLGYEVQSDVSTSTNDEGATA